MDWIVAPAVALALSSFLAYKIYNYRSLVIYKLTSASRYIKIVDDVLEVSDSYTFDGIGLAYNIITIENHGFKNVREFLLSSKENFHLWHWKVVSTSSIDSGSITVSESEDRLVITCPYLPRNEIIILEVSTKDDLRFWNVRGQGDQYRVKSSAFWDGYRSARSILLWIVSIGIISILAGLLIGQYAAHN